MKGSYVLFSALYPPHLGGIENFTQGLANALVARGNCVTVVTNDTEGFGAGRTCEDGVEVIRLPCFPLLSGRLPLPRHNTDFVRLMTSLEERSFDGVLVNARFYSHSLLGMHFAVKKGLTPVVLDHGSAPLSFSNPVLDPIVRLYEYVMTKWGQKRYAPVYYGVSEKSAEWVSSFGIQAEGVIPSAIDSVAYRSSASSRDYRHELGIPEKGLLVSFVGRLIPEKGVRAILDASHNERLLKTGVVFVLAGDGPLASEVSAADGPTLHWVGRLSREDSAALLLQSDLMCLPSDSEGFSIVLLEAAACDCPVLTTDVGIASELIPDESYGTIIPVASPEVLVGKLTEIHKCMDALPDMGLRYHKRAQERFSWDASAEAFEAACKRAPMRRGSATRPHR